MTTNRLEATHMIQIMLKWCSPYVSKQMLKDMDFEIAENTDNESLKQSIKMVLALIDEAKASVTWRYPEAVDLPTEEPDQRHREEGTEEEEEELPDSHGYKDDDYASDDTEQRKVDMTKRLNQTLQRAYKSAK